MIDHMFFINLFGIEKNIVQEKKSFDPNKIMKSSFFRVMQIIRTLFNKPQFYCRLDMSEICRHLNPVLLIISYCKVKFTFHGYNYFIFDRFRRKCSCSDMPISINSIQQPRLYFVRIFISKFILVFLDGT